MCNYDDDDVGMYSLVLAEEFLVAVFVVVVAVRGR
jgi:hypothetical protein